MKFDPVLDYQRTILRKSGIHLGSSDIALDAGCGRGDNSLIFAKTAKKVFAVDIEPWTEWNKYQSRNLEFHKADVTKLPFKSRQFTHVFSKDTLHHINDPGKALEEIRRVTVPGGLIYIVESNRFNPIFYIHMTKMLGHEHFSWWKFRSMILSKFGSVTFKNVESRVYPFSSLFLHKLLHQTELLIESLPLIRIFSSYNVAIIHNI